MQLGSAIGVALNDLLANYPIGEPRGFIRDDGVCVIVFQTQSVMLRAPSEGALWRKWVPCTDCGNLLSVPTNVVAATCPGMAVGHRYPVEDDQPQLCDRPCVNCGLRFNPLWPYEHASWYRARMDARRVEGTGVPICWTCTGKLVPAEADQVKWANAAIAYMP